MARHQLVGGVWFYVAVAARFITRISHFTPRAALAAAVLAAGLVVAAPAHAAPLWPGGPDVPGLPGTAAPVVSPAENSVVGGKQPVEVRWPAPVSDRQGAQGAISIEAQPGVAGDFVWADDRTVRWNPRGHWPRGASVSVTLRGTKTSFKVADDFTAVADAAAHTFTVKIGADVVRSVPASLGKRGHESPNGSFGVLEKFQNMVMDSSTYGVKVDSPQGYKIPVEYATRVTWDGIFVHAAPWSVAQQGKDNVSHGCINVSTADAKWYFENVRKGDQVVIQNADPRTK